MDLATAARRDSLEHLSVAIRVELRHTTRRAFRRTSTSAGSEVQVSCPGGGTGTGRVISARRADGGMDNLDLEWVRMNSIALSAIETLFTVRHNDL